MSTRVYHGLPSCLEVRTYEKRVLSIKWPPPASRSLPRLPKPAKGAGPASSDSREPQEAPYAAVATPTRKNKDSNKDKVGDDCDIKSQKSGELGGWSFIQALCNPSHTPKEGAVRNDMVYVHPLARRSSSKLSAKSLEMCTESLGSESGGGGGIIQTSSHEVPAGRVSSAVHQIGTPENSAEGELPYVWETGMKNKVAMNRSSASFPPPLTSMGSGGSGGLRVRPHRQDGRLVIEAVPVPACHSYFHAERSGGRLRLTMMRERFENCNNEETNEEDNDDDDDDEPVVVEEAMDSNQWKEVTVK